MSDTRWCVLLFAAAFLVRLVASMGAAIFGTDGCHYLLMADWMRAGRFHDALSVAYHPMYPLLIAVGTPLAGSAERAGDAVSILLGSASVVPLYRMALVVFGRPAAAITGLLYAFAPSIVEVQSDVMTEGTFIFFLFSSVWLTWRFLEEPSAVRGAVLGGAAAAAFLTRPEGLLAIAAALGWPLIGLARRKTPVGSTVAGLVCTLAVVLLLTSPYLLWVKSVRGHWSLSVRPSAISAEQAVGASTEEPASPYAGAPRLYHIYLLSLFRLSLYGLLIPFFFVGARSLLKRGRAFPSLFYLSYPIGLLGGILFTLRSHTFMAERYLMAGMALLSGLAALGLADTVAHLVRGNPTSKLRPAVCGAVLLVFIGLSTSKALKLRRRELRSYPVAAAAIRARDPHPKCVVGLEQVSYYCGTRSYYLPSDPVPLTALLKQEGVDYVVYCEKDVTAKPGYVATLRSLAMLEPPREVEGPPGTWKVYIHHVR